MNRNMSLMKNIFKKEHIAWFMPAISLFLFSCSLSEEIHTINKADTSEDSVSNNQKPNIIFIVADDMGWRDTGYSGNPVVKTPNLDEMSSVGLKFNNFYSAHATCSPGRMAILTGRTPLRARMVTTVGAMQAGEVTVAEALKTVSYDTAHFGKWGLGRKDTHPLNQGFDEAIWSKGHYNNGMSFFSGFSNRSDFDSSEKDERPIKTTGESSVATMELAIEFIQKRSKLKKPFFVQVCFGSPHGPHIAHPKFKKLYEELSKQDQNYYGEISGIDAAVGNLRTELRRLKIEDNTILWFVSDNGGIREGSGGKLKGKIGVRTLGLLEWPDKITNSMESHIPVSHMDMYPTILDITGITMKNQPIVDGISLLPLLNGRMNHRPKPLGFTRGGLSRKDGKFQIGDSVWIDGSFKLKYRKEQNKKLESITLFDLTVDPSESVNIVTQHPERAKEMVKKMTVWNKSVQKSFEGEDYFESK